MLKKLWSKLKKGFLTIFGDIKIYKWPMFIVYCPDSFRVKGSDTREIMKILRPGDLILRGYNHYLDGKFIPGKYSHTGIYIGEGKMIHAIAENVSYVDVIDFLRCDKCAVLRPKSGQKKAIERAKYYEENDTPYDFAFESNNDALYCHELGACAYEELDIQKKQPRLFGFTFGFQKCYLDSSFLESPDFKIVYEFQEKK